MKLGELKDYILRAEEEMFERENIGMPIIVAIENYVGDTIQAFYINVEENKAKIEKVLNENISKCIEDYGVKIDSLGVIKYLDELLEVADRDIDEYFNTNYDMLRLQAKSLDFKTELYEVVLSQTETKAGKIYVYADSKEEAEDIISDDINYYFEILEDTKEASCMNYDIEIESIHNIGKKYLPVDVNYIDEDETLYIKKDITEPEIEKMCLSVESMKDNLKDILRYRNVDNCILANLLVDIMDLSSEIKCELDEDDESSRYNIDNHIEEIQSKIERFLKDTL